jgi:hypothetical protein
VRIPNSHIVVIGDICGRKRVNGLPRQQSAKLDGSPFALRFESTPQHY